MGYVLGVDLGTTYCAAATAEGDRVDIMELGSRSATVPSVVFLRDDGEILVGDAAARRGVAEPDRVARETKRRLGDPVPLIIGGTPFSAESLMAHQLRAVVRDVTQEKGGPPDAVAVTHPASYGPYKLDLMRHMVEQADIGPVELLPEPVAAALHYGSQERIEPDTVVAVYDLGGGTFDAAVLRKTATGFEILGQPQGLDRLGGVDFDQAVFAHVAKAIGPAPFETDSPQLRAAVARLRDECREAKESLSSDTEATIQVLLPTVQTEVRLTRAEFEDMVRPRVRETIAALERSVRSAGLAFADVDRILLVGGSSRIPLVGQLVREATQRPVSRDSNPKHTIALGAALHAREAQRAVAPATEPSLTEEPAAAPVAPPPSVAVAQPPSAPAIAPLPSPMLPATPPVVDVSGGRNTRRLLVVAAVAGLAVLVAVGALLLSAPPGVAAQITDVQPVTGGYQVWFETRGFQPAEAAQRVHFYWDTLSEDLAASPEWTSQWRAWWGGSPVGVDGTNRPAQAARLCIVVATSSAVLRGSGNCFALPG